MLAGLAAKLLELPGARLPVEATYEERALYTIAGVIEVAGDTFEPGQSLVLRPGDPIVVRASVDARFMLFGGAPMEGPRYIWWNFVSSRPERIAPRKNGRKAASTPYRVTRKTSSRCRRDKTSRSVRPAVFSIHSVTERHSPHSFSRLTP